MPSILTLRSYFQAFLFRRSSRHLQNEALTFHLVTFFLHLGVLLGATVYKNKWQQQKKLHNRIQKSTQPNTKSTDNQSGPNWVDRVDLPERVERAVRLVRTESPWDPSKKLSVHSCGVSTKKCLKKSFCRGSFLNMKSRRPFYPTKKRFQLEKKDVILSRCVVWFHPTSWSSNHSIGKWYHPQSYNPGHVQLCNNSEGKGAIFIWWRNFFPFNLQLRLPFLELVTRWQIPPPSTQRCSFFETKIQTITCHLKNMFIQNPTPK